MSDLVWHEMKEKIEPTDGWYLFWAECVDYPCVWWWSKGNGWGGTHSDRHTYHDPFHYSLGYSHWAKVGEPDEQKEYLATSENQQSLQPDPDCCCWYTVRLDANMPETTLGDRLQGPKVFDSVEDAYKCLEDLFVAFPQFSIFRHTELPTVSDYSRGERI